jgi:hypothetical protein
LKDKNQEESNNNNPNYIVDLIRNNLKTSRSLKNIDSIKQESPPPLHPSSTLNNKSKFVESVQQILIDKIRSTKRLKKSFKKKLLSSSSSSIEFKRKSSNCNKNTIKTMTAQMASFLKLTLVGDGGVGKVCLIFFCF